jgi:hypothetical protein
VKDEEYLEALQSLGKEDQKTESTLHQEAGVLYRKLKLWVPGGLLDSVLQIEHELGVVGNMRHDKTKEFIMRNFRWPKMNEEIIQYILSCPECQHNNVPRHKAYGLLQPLEPAYARWQSIAMDFITGLLLCEGCDQLWVIINRYAKIAHFIPLKKKNKKAEDLETIFAREIWRRHSIPADIPGLQVYIKILKVINCHTRYTTMDVDRIPSANRGSNRAHKSDDRNISPIVCKSKANRVGRVTARRRVRFHQQYHKCPLVDTVLL